MSRKDPPFFNIARIVVTKSGSFRNLEALKSLVVLRAREQHLCPDERETSCTAKTLRAVEDLARKSEVKRVHLARLRGGRGWGFHAAPP